jgi:hypothetical protein
MAGVAFSLASLLEPLPPETFSTVLRVASAVHKGLLVPVLQKVLQAKHDTTVGSQLLDNVVYKIEKYLPAVVQDYPYLGGQPAVLKEFQDVCAELPLVAVPPARSHCPCGEAVEVLPSVDRARIAPSLIIGEDNA